MSDCLRKLGKELHGGMGTKGPLVKEFARVEVFRSGHRGAHLPIRGWLLIERPISKPARLQDRKYYFAWKLDGLSLEELVELAHIRWVIERFYQDAKGELGLDHYEGRRWTGFHRHVALVMLAHCYLTLRQSYGADIIEQGPPSHWEQSQNTPTVAPGRGFPPKGRKSMAALRRAVLEELFRQVIGDLSRIRDGT